MSDRILQSLTDNVILHMHEKKSLKKLAAKITKIPDVIHIPSEYLVKKSGE